MKGVIKCRRLDRDFPISGDAVPDEDWHWICPCGKWTGLDPKFHEVIYDE